MGMGRSGGEKGERRGEELASIHARTPPHAPVLTRQEGLAAFFPPGRLGEGQEGRATSLADRTTLG